MTYYKLKINIKYDCDYYSITIYYFRYDDI